MPATNLPPALQSLSVFLCERVLQEKDNVLTFIRNVEVFNVAITQEIPIERQGATLTVVVMGKLQPNDAAEHSVRIQIIRPSGETKSIGEEHRSVFPANLPNYPGGFTIVLPVIITPKELGIHYVTVLFDGEEAARAPFMLQPAKADKAQ